MASLGTFKLTDSGVTLSRRGVGVVMDVSFKELEVWAAKNKLDEKRLWKRSFGRAVSGLKGKFRKVMAKGGGVNGVPKFKSWEDFTVQLRQAKGRRDSMGGKLADKRFIVGYKRGDTQYIGWPQSMAEWAVKFQDGTGSDSDFNNPYVRHDWHKLGIKDIPRTYISNPRKVIPEPFGSYVEKQLEGWARGAFYKDLAKQMAKQRISAK